MSIQRWIQIFRMGMNWFLLNPPWGGHLFLCLLNRLMTKMWIKTVLLIIVCCFKNTCRLRKFMELKKICTDFSSELRTVASVGFMEVSLIAGISGVNNASFHVEITIKNFSLHYLTVYQWLSHTGLGLGLVVLWLGFWVVVGGWYVRAPIILNLPMNSLWDCQ